MPTTNSPRRYRVRRIMSNLPLIAAWSNQTQESGSNPNHSLYFEGDTIYSYGRHYPLARFVTAKGRRFVLVNLNDYSVTTTRHRSLVLRAIRDRYAPIFVDNPAADLEANLEADIRRRAVYERRLAFARRGASRINRMGALAHVVRDGNTLRCAYGLPENPYPDGDMEQYCQSLKARFQQQESSHASNVQ